MLSSDSLFTLQQNEETILDTSASHSSSEQCVFTRFTEMEKKRENINITTYFEFWKQTSTTQTILLS